MTTFFYYSKLLPIRIDQNRIQRMNVSEAKYHIINSLVVDTHFAQSPP